MPQLLECGAGYEEARAAEFAKAQEESDSEDEELGGWSRDDLSLGAKAVAVPLLSGHSKVRTHAWDRLPAQCLLLPVRLVGATDDWMRACAIPRWFLSLL